MLKSVGVDLGDINEVTKFHKDLLGWFNENLQRGRDYEFGYEYALWKCQNGQASFPEYLFINDGEYMVFLKLKFGL